MRWLLALILLASCATSPEPWHFTDKISIAKCYETCEGQRDFCFMMHDDVIDCGDEYDKCMSICGP